MTRRCHAPGSSAGIAKADFNGDGFADLAVGEPFANLGAAEDAGDVLILMGSANGLSASGRQVWDEGKIPAASYPANVTPGIHGYSYFGDALAAGDFNGDGYSDLAIGVPGRDLETGIIDESESGIVIAIYGSPTGLTTGPGAPPPQILNLPQLDSYSFSFGFSRAFFGWALAWGDFSGDGYGDLVVGAPMASRLWGQGNEVGVVAVFPGGPQGLTVRNPNVQSAQYITAESLGIPRYDFTDFGSRLTGGDFNGDGRTDLVIGCSDCAGSKGLVAVISGSATGVAPDTGTPAARVWTASNLGASASAGDTFGKALSVGDFNGDGKQDLAIGVPGAQDVWVLPGSPTGLGRTGSQRWTPVAIGRPDVAQGFGTSLAAGDFNADGRSDLAIGAPFFNSDVGEVDVIYGSSNGLSTTAVRGPQAWTRNSLFGTGTGRAGDRFGTTLSAWNFGRNEAIVGPNLTVITKRATDLAIGVEQQDGIGTVDSGGVTVIYGSYGSNGLVKTSPNSFDADNTNMGGVQSGARLGRALY